MASPVIVMGAPDWFFNLNQFPFNGSTAKGGGVAASTRAFNCATASLAARKDSSARAASALACSASALAFSLADLDLFADHQANPAPAMESKVQMTETHS